MATTSQTMRRRKVLGGALWVVLGGAFATGGNTKPALAAMPIVDDCHEADYQDRTGDPTTRALTWDYSFPATANRCIRVHVGQTVRWIGNFAEHPLDPDQGDTPNPIATHDATGAVTFGQPGVFGFRCNYHFEMRGAIHVVPAGGPVAVPWARVAGRIGLVALLILAGVLATRRISRTRHT